MHKAFHLKRDVDRLYVQRKEGGKWLASIEDSVDASTQRLEDYTGRLITAIRSNTDNASLKRANITRIQKRLYEHFKRPASEIAFNKTWIWSRNGCLKREKESLRIAVQNNAIRANTPNQAETLLHSSEQAAAVNRLHINEHKTKYMCFKQTGDISTLDGSPLKLVDKFTYLGSSVSSNEKDIDTRLTKAWTAIDRLSIIWKSDLTDKMKRNFFQAAVVSILLYGWTTWTLIKWLEKRLNGNFTRMLRAILNKSWRQHHTKHQLYGHPSSITKTYPN